VVSKGHRDAAPPFRQGSIGEGSPFTHQRAAANAGPSPIVSPAHHGLVPRPREGALPSQYVGRSRKDNDENEAPGEVRIPLLRVGHVIRLSGASFCLYSL
jgi:hypothetical protein